MGNNNKADRAFSGRAAGCVMPVAKGEIVKPIKDKILSARVETEFFDDVNTVANMENMDRAAFIVAAVEEKMIRIQYPVKAAAKTYTPDLATHQRIDSQRTEVGRLMRDGKWRTVPEIQEALQYPPASIPAIGARLRDMRKPKYGAYTVDRNKRQPGLHKFRVTK